MVGKGTGSLRGSEQRHLKAEEEEKAGLVRGLGTYITNTAQRGPSSRDLNIELTGYILQLSP